MTKSTPDIWLAFLEGTVVSWMCLKSKEELVSGKTIKSVMLRFRELCSRIRWHLLLHLREAPECDVELPRHVVCHHIVGVEEAGDPLERLAQEGIKAAGTGRKCSLIRCKLRH